MAFVNNVEDGRRSDPTSKFLEDKLNINLELTGTIEATYPSQITAMIAANDLPDVFYFSNTTQQLPMVFASKSLLNIDPYLKEWAPYSATDPRQQVMFEAKRQPAYSPDGNLYTWGLCKGTWDDGTEPTTGQYIQWDVYKKAGYPKLKNFEEDMLNALEAMVKAEPTNKAGDKTWGLGAWFGDGGSWGEWFIRGLFSTPLGYNINTASGSTLAIDISDSTPLSNNLMTDPNSIYWRAVRWYNKAYQRGLLDPDSFTQKQAIYEDRLNTGIYMHTQPGWDAVRANKVFAQDPNNQKAFLSLPGSMLGTQSEGRFGDMYQGERTYGIAAKTRYPERCVALLDYVSTYEFSRYTFSGLEGRLWKYENSKPIMTKEALTTPHTDPYRIQHGVEIYGHFMGYGYATINPADGVAVDLYQYSPEAVELKLSPAHKDFISHFGQKTLLDVYKAETPKTGSYNFFSFGNPPDDLKNYVNNLDNYRAMNVFKMMAAKTDAEFDKMLNDTIAGMKDFHVDEIFDYFYKQAVAQKPIVDKFFSMMK
jgi:ABC-type glycerol-3-phosphate transport system substrate-binding protein